MSTSRQFSKTLAIASNYDIPDAGVDTVKASLNYSIPSAYDCIEFAEFKAIAVPEDWLTFDLYGLTVTAQVAASADLVFTMYQRPNVSLAATAQLTLTAGDNFAQLVKNPPVIGLAKANTYFIRCTCADPDAFAEGVELAYTVAKF
jgi:hypothetical protein